MEVRSYRAGSLQEALRLIRNDLGPDAAVLHTREVQRGWLGLLSGPRQIEVTASLGVHVPSRFPPADGPAAVQAPAPPPTVKPRSEELRAAAPAEQLRRMPAAHEQDYRAKFRDDLKCQIADLQSMVEQLCRRSEESRGGERSDVMFGLYTDLIDAEVSEELARELIQRVRTGLGDEDLDDAVLVRARLTRLLEEEIDCCGPLVVTPGQRRLVALIGPTGVGKTTTIAKLAANFHLQNKCRVGLITVDTYRIAAVDQLRTYADIIDLPMEVVATRREMRAALDRFAELDLVLLDTAGRSPRDEVRLRELQSLLAEAQPDEVHLVLSSVASVASLRRAAERFAEVGATALVLTKLDEATGWGNLLPLLRRCGLPVSYITHGQSVPADIAAADRRQLARGILGMETGR